MNHKKSRLTDLFRKMDKNNDGLIPRDDFIDGIMKTSKFIINTDFSKVITFLYSIYSYYGFVHYIIILVINYLHIILIY